MIAAIYARKSTDQAGVADEQRSVTRQIEHARIYALRKGWVVDEASVFVDDGISGAEFANRPGFLRLMNALKPRAPFQVLVMSEESRLGREAIETAYALKQIVTAGVRVFFYLEDRERTLDSPTDKIMMSLTAFADELEREKGRQRTHDAMIRKARAGHVTGGRVFGYDNVDVTRPDGTRSHVERRVNEDEAAVVQKIFTWCAAGMGYTRIAKRLNAERAVCPRPQQGRPAGWAPSSVNDILHRAIYRGEVIWNATRKRDSWGQQQQHDRPESDWICRSAPELRIISEDVWNAAHARLRGIRAHLSKVTGGRMGGRTGPRSRDLESRYLLAGFARCAVCGGGLSVTSRSHGHQRAYFYGCLAYHKRGTSVCGNSLVLPMERIDEAVLGTLESDVLTPAVVQALIAAVLDGLKPEALALDATRTRAELATVRQELERLTDAIAAGGDMESLVEAVKARQVRQTMLTATLSGREVSSRFRFDRRLVEKQVRAKLADWRTLLTTHVQDGRQLLREVLTGPLRFTPEGRTYRFEGEAAIGRLISGMAGLPTFVASPMAINRAYRWADLQTTTRLRLLLRAA